MGQKKSVIRVGDLVRIDNPLLFIRCGYPINFQMECREIIKKHKQDIIDFLRKTEINTDTDFNTERLLTFGFPKLLCNVELDEYDCNSYPNYFSKIVKAIAYETLNIKNFGGKERSIYTELNEEYRGKEYIVDDIHFHMTGIYTSGMNTYDDCYSYIYNQKRHKILELGFYPRSIRIEDIHVTKIEKGMNNG